MGEIIMFENLIDNTKDKREYRINVNNLVEGYNKPNNSIVQSTDMVLKDNVSVKLQLPDTNQFLKESLDDANSKVDIKSANYQDGKIQVVDLVNEEWRDTKVDPFLKISNYGRVYDKMLGVLLNEKPNFDGYLTVTVRGKRYLIHQLLLEAFSPLPNEKMRKIFVPDHINRVRTYNTIFNLRWATNSENASNTANNISNLKTENTNELDFLFSRLAKIIYNESQGNKAQSYRELYNEFASKFPTSDKTGDLAQFKKYVSRFKTGSRRQLEFIEYLKPYGLEGIFEAKNNPTTVNPNIIFKTKKQKERERVERMCQILDGQPSSFTARDVARDLGELDRYDNDIKFRHSFNTKISDIRNNKIFTDISSKYDINRVTLSDHDVYTICTLIDKGLHNEEIIDVLGIKDRDERDRYQCRLSLIRSGKILTKVSKNFNFMKVNNN